MPAKKKKFHTKRILEETVTYRLLLIGVNFVIFNFIFDDPQEAGFIVLIRHVIQTGLFLGNEYLWEEISWGTNKNGEHSRMRTFAKTIFFRIVTIISDMIILLFIADVSLSVATSTTIILAIVNTTLYYFHERMWESISSKNKKAKR